MLIVPSTLHAENSPLRKDFDGDLDILDCKFQSGKKRCTRQPGRSPMMTFFGLAHMVDATQLLGWGGVGWGRDDDIL